jgi:putative hydroxymethylpyrimidine transport system substrate-binding protein
MTPRAKSRRCLIALVMVILLAGCGSEAREEADSSAARSAQAESKRTPDSDRFIHMALNGPPGAENVGLVMAKQRGYFKDVGLRVAMGTPISSGNAVQYVVEQSVDFSVIPEPEVVLAQEEGLPLYAVRSLLPQPTGAMIWLKRSKIDGLADLKGKTIVTQGWKFQESFLEALLARVGLKLSDVKIESLRDDLVPALASGKADVIFGGSWNLEGVALKARGLEPVITRFDELGIPPYDELLLVGNRNRLPREEKLIGPFMSALERGIAAAIAHPRAAARAIAAESFEPRRKAPRWEGELRATLPLLSRSGHMDPGRAERLVEWMHDQRLIDGEPPVSELFTDRYLPSRP